MHPDPVHTLPLQAVRKLLLLSHNTLNILSQSNTEHSYDNIQEMFLLLFLFNWHDIPPIICIEIWLWWEEGKLGKVYSLALENNLILWNSKRFSGDESWKGALHCREAPLWRKPCTELLPHIHSCDLVKPPQQEGSTGYSYSLNDRSTKMSHLNNLSRHTEKENATQALNVLHWCTDLNFLHSCNTRKEKILRAHLTAFCIDTQH